MDAVGSSAPENCFRLSGELPLWDREGSAPLYWDICALYDNIHKTQGPQDEISRKALYLCTSKSICMAAICSAQALLAVPLQACHTPAQLKPPRHQVPPKQWVQQLVLSRAGLFHKPVSPSFVLWLPPTGAQGSHQPVWMDGDSLKCGRKKRHKIWKQMGHPVHAVNKITESQNGL